MVAAMARPSAEEHYGDHLASLLEEGEDLLGVCSASEQQGMFKGRAVLLAVTDRRLIVVGLDRRGRPAGDAASIAPGDLESADADGAGGGWAELGPAIMDHAAVKLKLRTRDGDKHRFMLMRGTGPLGNLGGGESQRAGVDALAAFFERAGL
jgi:hypothetical protein